MAEKGPAKGKEEEKAPKLKPDLIRDLWKGQARLKFHLSNGTVIEGRIKQFDQWNLQVRADVKRYWVPKHAVVLHGYAVGDQSIVLY